VVLVGVFVFNFLLAIDVFAEWSYDTSDPFGYEGALAGGQIKVDDKGVVKQTIIGWVQEKAADLKDMIYQKFVSESLKNSVSQTFWSALNKALNTVAYDTATWLGSGGKGQKPLFITEDWGTYITNVGDNFAGEFIGKLSKEWQFNLCEPDFDVKFGITIGLVNMQKPRKPSCTFTEMKKNWDQELSRADFLNRFQDMFNPASNDLGQALTIQTGFLTEKTEAELNAKFKDLQVKQGWLDVTGVSGEIEGLPVVDQVKYRMELNAKLKAGGMTAFTGTFQDAANVFLNQLAISLFNKLMANLASGKGSISSPYSGDYGLSNYHATGGGGGTQVVKNRFNKIIEPNFAIRGDYDILAELTMCPDPNKAGPTNCVITDKFRQAIEQKMTIGEALSQGYLSPQGIFGFTSDGLEPKFNEGYPYRSMIILRKFRILPVGWELAAQYIKDNPEVTKSDDDFFALIKAAQAGSSGTKNLKDLVDCFDPNDEYEGYEESWCNGLVDPSWVLKAPLNYCKREGYGPELLTDQVTGTGADSQRVISRNDNYCADEQSCIKEKNDGSCDIYGYCTEERRKWNFGNDSCDPNYNTCQTFRTRDGKTVSYLENTLDYNQNNCSADNAGCREYKIAGDPSGYDASSGKYDWNKSSQSLHFDRDAVACESDKEGCHEFIRLSAGNGVNLYNGFEDGFSAYDQDKVFGDKSVHLSSDIAAMSVPLFSGLALDLTDEAYTLSLFAKNCGTNGSIAIGSEGLAEFSSSTLETTGEWQKYATTHYFTAGSEVWFSVTGITDGNDCANNNCCLIDGFKVERGGSPTNFSEYGQTGKFYQKLLPGYLSLACYENYPFNLALKENAPEVCGEYVRECSQDEVGCKLFTATKDGMSVPARVTTMDYCDQSCVDYDSYLQTETFFDSEREDNIIPRLSDSCSAEYVGCEQFTNLDRVGDKNPDEYGAEDLEYYSYLRQCTREDEPTCDEFYTWEGSSEAGYQLKVHKLRGDSNIDGPYVYDTVFDGLTCDSSTYNLLNNSMCMEFYSKSGNISYAFYPYTITCSGDCHPFRMTAINDDPSISDSATCSGGVLCSEASSDGLVSCWDPTPGVGLEKCNICKGNGKWDFDQKACVYMAIPNEGKQCSASQNGCREYSGSAGANTRIVSQSYFEGNEIGWQLNNGTNYFVDTESLRVGEHSLAVGKGDTATAISYPVSGIVRDGKSYHLSFLAKKNTLNGSAGNNFTNIYFANGIATSSFFGGVVSALSISHNWQIVEINLTVLDHEVLLNEFLTIESDGDYYIDNIVLTEIIDKYYLIKNSSKIPEVCYDDIFGNYRGPDWNLGCEEYADSDQNIHYLRQFSELCQDGAVGCEMMIDTKNSNNHQASLINDTNINGTCDAGEDDCISLAKDDIRYVVYDQTKECVSEERGCERLGEVSPYLDQEFFTDKYLLNNPDGYATSLCGQSDAGCEEWTTEEGIDYFKNPGDQTCEWRQEANVGATGFGWFQKKMMRCDMNADGAVLGTDDACKSGADCGLYAAGPATCATSADCDSDPNKDYYSCIDQKCYYSCVQDKVDYPCYTSPLKTFGIGGSGNKIDQPTEDPNGYNWTGICSVSDSGCTEYIDPMSVFSPSTIFNSDFSQNVDDDGNPATTEIADGWSAASNGEQDIDLEANTLYVFAVEGSGLSATLQVTGNNLLEIKSDNETAGVNTISLATPATSGRVSKTFYSIINTSAKVVVNDASHNPALLRKVELKKAVVDYQLAKDENKTECNGVVDFKTGCVLFNKRSQNGVGKNSLIYDADKNTANPTTINPINDTVDSNELLKVEPNRVCDKWLACKSFIKDEGGENVCYDIGLCDSFDKNGNCSNFVVESKNNIIVPTVFDKKSVLNFSGYVKPGHSDSDSLRAGYVSFGTMKQDGEMAKVPNGSFEYYSSQLKPIGWSTYSPKEWNENLFSVINNPVANQNEGIGKTPDGRSVLKMSSEDSRYSPQSEFISVEPNVEYILSAFADTSNFSGKDGKKVSFAVAIYGYNSGTLLANGIMNTSGAPVSTVLSDIQGGMKWDDYYTKFRTGPNTSFIKIHLFSYDVVSNTSCQDVAGNDNCVGNIFVDDIKIKPSIGVKKVGASYDYVSQTCRLYPESDSLSCEYYEDSGKRAKGLSGYCMEYDRNPGGSEACLMWYPIDKVKGDGIDEGVGYNGKAPVYYCAEAEVLMPVEYRKGQNGAYSQDESGAIASNVPGWVNGNLGAGCGNYCFFWIQPPQTGCLFDCQPYVIHGGSWYDGQITAGSGWYKFDGFHKVNAASFSFNEADSGLKFYDPSTQSLYDDVFAYCKKIVKVVDDVGHNKFWSARVYQGSDYLTNPNGYSYELNSAPFGSMVSPISSDPFSWDGDAKAGFQPIYFRPSSQQNTVNAGFPYSAVNATGLTFGKCSISNRLCLDLPGADVVSKAECSSGEGVCTPINFGADPVWTIKRIFAQSYGGWVWDAATSHYQPVSDPSLIWSAPTTACNGTGNRTRPGANSEYCGIKPEVTSMSLEGGNSGNVLLKKGGFVNFTFNSLLDENQMPVVMQGVKWGDDEELVVTGVELRDRINEKNPHQMYHLYTYWDMKAKNSYDQNIGGSIGENSVYCGDAGAVANNFDGQSSGYTCPNTSACCVAKPKVKIKDNWGWCTEGSDNRPCMFDNKCVNASNATNNASCESDLNCSGAYPYCRDGYYEFNGWVVVTEK